MFLLFTMSFVCVSVVAALCCEIKSIYKRRLNQALFVLYLSMFLLFAVFMYC